MYNNTTIIIQVSQEKNMLAENIKKYRNKLGLTQEALARKANISYNTIIKIESKGIIDPRVGTLRKIANALEVTIDKLVVGKND